MNGPPPRLVATVGMHGSASTWVFNVVREIMETAVGAADVLAIYTEEAPTLVSALLKARYVVVKSHSGGPALDSMIRLARAPVFATIRDPRDAAISLAQRFGTPVDAAVRAIARDCRLALRCAEAGHLVLRYEDRFFEDETLPARLAGALGVTVEPETLAAIAARYSTEAVRAFTAGFADLPEGRVIGENGIRVDRITQIHRTHIGDGQVGKWRDFFPPDSGREITRVFAPFFDRFGYEA